MVALADAFFLQTRDIRRLMRLFPGATELETTQKPRPVRYRHRENEPNSYRDEYVHDNYDRYDSGEKHKNTNKNSKGSVTNRYDQHHHKRVYHNDKRLHHHSHPHLDCDHHDHLFDHHHSKFSEDRNRNKYEDSDEYYDRKSSYSQGEKRKHQNNNKKGTGSDEKESEYENYDKNVDEKRDHPKKDYITGVLVTIPKIKNEEEVGGYFKDNKQQNVFFQHLLKTDDDEDHHHHHHIPAEDIRYIY
jgi:hypothetical protein